MLNVEKVSVALTSEMVATVRKAVDAGEYGSASEAMREAMRDWMLRRVQRSSAVTEIGRLWDEGVESGESVDGDLAFERIQKRLALRSASSGS